MREDRARRVRVDRLVDRLEDVREALHAERLRGRDGQQHDVRLRRDRICPLDVERRPRRPSRPPQPGPDWPLAFGLPCLLRVPDREDLRRSSGCGNARDRTCRGMPGGPRRRVGLPYESTSTIVWPAPVLRKLVDAVRLADVARQVAVEVAAGRRAARPARVVRDPARLDLHRPARRLEGRRAEASRGRRARGRGSRRDDRERGCERRCHS